MAYFKPVTYLNGLPYVHFGRITFETYSPD